MKKQLIMGIIVLGLLVPAFAQEAKIIHAQGRYESHQVDSLPVFQAIQVNGDMEVIFTQADERQVTLSGRKNLVDVATVEVKDQTLVIGYSRPVRVRAAHKLRVEVSAPTLVQVEVSQGEFEVRGALHGEHLTLLARGSGDIELDHLQLDTLEAVASDKADIELSRVDVRSLRAVLNHRAQLDLSGRTEEAYLENNSSQELDASDLRAQVAHVVNNDGGDTQVWARKALKVEAHGRGKIEIKGYPVSVERLGNKRKIKQE